MFPWFPPECTGDSMDEARRLWLRSPVRLQTSTLAVVVPYSEWIDTHDGFKDLSGEPGTLVGERASLRY
jgi:hypothetical protein